MRFSFPETESREGPVRILFVCTGNICRSPLAEVLLRHELRDLPVVVTSAGTHALEGRAMTEQNQRIAETNGAGDAHAHMARQVTRDMIKDSDLVLALSREHRRHIVNMVPRANRYAFTLREFGRVALTYCEQSGTSTGTGITPDEIRNAIRSAAKLRGTLPLLDDPGDDDVVDPYRGDAVVYQQSAAELIPSILDIAKLLRTSMMGVK